MTLHAARLDQSPRLQRVHALLARYVLRRWWHNGGCCMKNINPRAWAHTPAKRIARTDHLLDAWGDIFSRLGIRAILQITFERFIEMPHHHLHRLRSRLANIRDDQRLNFWGDIFLMGDVARKLSITFEQFLATPNY